jgi:hypothetical protein
MEVEGRVGHESPLMGWFRMPNVLDQPTAKLAALLTVGWSLGLAVILLRPLATVLAH